MSVAAVRPTALALGVSAGIGALACGATPGEPAEPPTVAVATPSCSPTDGPAVQIVMASGFAPVQRPMPPYVSVTLARRPEELAGRTWRVGDAVLVGAARQPATGALEFATRGAVRVTRVAFDTSMEGTLDLHFPSGARVQQTFRARWSPAPPGPRCG